MRIVGILGAAGSGKDSVAAYLARTYGLVVKRFADPLKELVAASFGWDRAHLEDLAFKETPDPRWGGTTPRRALQLIGTEGFRACDPDYWVKRAQARLQAAKNLGCEGVVLPDVRFTNEAKLLRDNGALLLRTVKIDGPGTSETEHASEQEQATIEVDWELSARHGQLDLLWTQADMAYLGLASDEALQTVRQTYGALRARRGTL